MMRPPEPLCEEILRLYREYSSQFSEEEKNREIDDDEADTYFEELGRWQYDHASEKLKLYWDYRKWVGDEGQLCDGNGHYILQDNGDPHSWIQEWDVNEDGFCVYVGTDKLILNFDGSPIADPVLDKRVEDMYDCVYYAEIPG